MRTNYGNRELGYTLPQARVQWWTFVNMFMSLRVS